MRIRVFDNTKCTDVVREIYDFSDYQKRHSVYVPFEIVRIEYTFSRSLKFKKKFFLFFCVKEFGRLRSVLVEINRGETCVVFTYIFPAFNQSFFSHLCLDN